MSDTTVEPSNANTTAGLQGKITSRWQAFGIHLFISGLIFVVLAYLVLYHWYPDFFFDTDGGWEGMRILVAVDLVLGPMLTLIVFKAGKPGMRNDLIMIGVFQALCLAAGVYVVSGERPLALVYADGQFNSMTANSYTDAGVEIPDFSRYTGPSPKRLQVVLPQDPVAQHEARREMMQAKRFMNLATQYYQPLDANTADFASSAYDLADIKDRDQETQDLPRFVAEHGGEVTDYYFFPLNTRYSYLFLGVSKHSGEVAGILRTPGPL